MNVMNASTAMTLPETAAPFNRRRESLI